MANSLVQDPLVFDAAATDVNAERIEALKYVGDGTASIIDSITNHPLWSTDETCFDAIHLKIASGLVDVAVSGGVLYIYLGSGPR